MRISGGMLLYLQHLVAADIRKHDKQIRDFSLKEGQSEADARVILARFKDKQVFREDVLDLIMNARRTRQVLEGSPE